MGESGESKTKSGLGQHAPCGAYTLRAGRRRDPWAFSGLKLRGFVRQREKSVFTPLVDHP